MKPLKNLLILFLFVCFWQSGLAQNNNGGRFSGSLETNGNFFLKDEAIRTPATPQYEYQLYGADAWMQLNYSNWGFDLGLRFDLFNNSILLNPTDSYTAQGIGRWFISKKIHKLKISAGYLYDQIGSGIIFRAYEQRPLLIDNALYGLRTTYELNENWKVKVFTGKQKLQFDTYASIIKGASIDGFIPLDSNKWSLAPGFGVTNRTLDDASMDVVVGELANYVTTDSISPRYNSYAFSLYNTLSLGRFSWYVEGAYKTDDVFSDPFSERTLLNGSKILGKLVSRPGTVLYSSLSYAAKGFGGTVEYKRTQDFTFRTNPFVELNRGMVNFLPPMTRVNTYRLTARYNAATQELGEQAFQIDLRYRPIKKLSFNVNFSNITNLPRTLGDSTVTSELLYREIFTEAVYKYKRKWTLTAGLQLQTYNQAIFENKFGVPNVETIIPYVDFLYKFTRKKSLRVEAQYMAVGEDEKAGAKQDYGNWLFGLAEFSMAPHWSFVISDMYNINPGKNSPADLETGEKSKLHYPRFDVFYTHKSNRFSLSYVKQVDGIVCTGGICRLEPAFSGVKLTINSTF